MDQQCKDCIHSEVEAGGAPCNTCTQNSVWSNFTPKKGLNELLRERLGENKEPWPDVVKRPSHYILKPGLEVRDVLELLVDKLQQTLPYPGNTPLFESDYVQMMQYLMRFMNKNGKQDLEKARWYLDKLIEAYE